MSLAFLFPGQGAQSPGFLHRLPDHPAVAATLQEASAVLGREVLELDEASALQSTVAVQIGLLVAGAATARALAAEGVAPAMVAGLSVGSFAAAVTAGALTFPDALRLVDRRARLMEQACPAGFGMVAVTGLTQRRVETIVAAAGPLLYLANLNGPAEFVLSGADPALDRAIDAAQQAGARRAERLAVAVPSHCPLMDDAAAALTATVESVPVAAPRIAMVGNRRARVLRDVAAVREELATNLAHPVRWSDSVTLMAEHGATTFLEMPPGTVLTRLAAAEFPDLAYRDMESLSLAGARAFAARAGDR
ncbi:malonate decarboxylase subunit epsilon [Mycobacterium sp. KBS0706]|uniref:malonate decarboxylase subunit epsilon n=1 Tax=Mycobacterium sp. KBS0706 TaxID=2578109 RepID=UPI00110FCC23|nr:malonate decarboxylase subunit epsilon [Mycobacterium sp. KBS0706]TSD90462.1 malonate decarboxylase subunit epsilon [Mycobacterium sp. KBS0706]